MPIIEIRDAANKPVAINVAQIEHIEGTATKVITVKAGELISKDYTGNPVVVKEDTNYTVIDWSKNVKIVMMNGTTYTVKPEELQLLQSQGELGLRKANPLGY